MENGVLDEVYERLRDTGPERDGWLSNHAPMAAEALVRHGHGAQVHGWLDGYADRLSERPRGIQRISAGEWREPLGDPVRTGDWLTFFERQLTERPWREVLIEWWPRLLPGVAAGATHGVIRVGHAVRALLDSELTGTASPARVAELAAGLGYWAARWQPLAPAGKGPYRAGDLRAALDAVPRVPHQRSGIRTRLAQLADLPGWAESAGAVPGDEAAGVPSRLDAIVEAAVLRYGTHGHGNPVMLVHAATAPNAVARVLPVLPAALWQPSMQAAWAATAAVTSAYSPAAARPMPGPGAADAADLMNRGLHDQDSHGIKFIDTALDVHRRTGEQTVLDVAAYANHLIVRG
ncbi:hypothetical protein CS0771_55460 [Catellatospora sp. IY07-71]|uniref:questin oxidase family protein n=1 Tax=Catellatospora sp. IY07-71 TaxID=2728827 RepID=UPI001BB34272|nr:questin oxidase family protein [Catellatospora sp. IY07-71]BCJ76002.1 hypothetical protein CS0771_55460 [Catellatospora sp. IY07-71]